MIALFLLLQLLVFDRPQVPLELQDLPTIEEACEPSVVYWRDATMYSKIRYLPPAQNILTKMRTYGCAQIHAEAGALLVHYNFADGEPDSVLALPFGWVTLVVPMEAKILTEEERVKRWSKRQKDTEK